MYLGMPATPTREPRRKPLLLAYHTNRPLTNETPPAGLRLLSGWWADGVPASQLQQLQQRHRGRIRKPWNLLQVFKYEWLLNATASARDDELWLLMDTDTLVQCDAGHLRRRFKAMATPLLIGAEKQQRGVYAPLALKKGAKDGAAYWATDAMPAYQNSGMLMGTRAGLRQLVRTMRSFDRFPCCPRMHVDGSLSKSECRVDDQVCLFAALASPGMRAPSADGGAASRPAFELDVNATLFASLAWQARATAPVGAQRPARCRRPPRPARDATRAPEPRGEPPARTQDEVAVKVEPPDSTPTGSYMFTYPITVKPRRLARPCAMHFPGLARIGMEGRLRAGLPHIAPGSGIWQPTGPKGSKLARYIG